LNYFGARYYSPATGRFLTVDPALQYPSPYIYAGNNPLKFVDRDGRWGSLAVKGGSLLVVGLLGGYAILKSRDVLQEQQVFYVDLEKIPPTHWARSSVTPHAISAAKNTINNIEFGRRVWTIIDTDTEPLPQLEGFQKTEGLDSSGTITPTMLWGAIKGTVTETYDLELKGTLTEPSDLKIPMSYQAVDINEVLIETKRKVIKSGIRSCLDRSVLLVKELRAELGDSEETAWLKGIIKEGNIFPSHVYVGTKMGDVEWLGRIRGFEIGVELSGVDLSEELYKLKLSYLKKKGLITD